MIKLFIESIIQGMGITYGIAFAIVGLFILRLIIETIHDKISNHD